MARKLILFLVVIALLATFLAWRTPAGWALSLARDRVPELSWSGVEGTVWHGQVEGLTWRGMSLGRADWRFDGLTDWGRRETAWQIQSESSQHRLEGRLILSPWRLSRAEHVAGHFPATWIDLAQKLPGLYLDGDIALDFEHVNVEGRLPGSVSGRLTWQHAGISGSVQESLGALELRISPEAGNPANANRFVLNSVEPADLTVEGSGGFQGNDYEIEVKLTINPFRQDMSEFFEPLGETGPDGRVWLRWQGSFYR